MTKRRGKNGDDAPITVTYGNHLIDSGMASLPNAFSRFYRCLIFDREHAIADAVRKGLIV